MNKFDDIQDNEIQYWENKSQEMYNIQHYFVLALRLILFTASVILITVILCIRKQIHFFYIATPISFLLSGALGVFIELRFLFFDWKTVESGEYNDIALLLAFHYMFYTTGHQFFAS